MNPVAQRLPVHPADLRRCAAIHPISNRSQRKKPPALIDVLRPAGERPKRLRRIVFPQSHRCWHGANLLAPNESQIPIRGNRNHESADGAFGMTCAEPLIEAVDPGALIADKAFDADAFIAALNDRAIAPVIPSKSNRKTPRPCDFALYCERNLIERFFNKLKHFRAIATRYDKLAKIFLAGVHLACAAILLN